jgi:hypothetical protein
VSKEYLHRYLWQFDFLWNARKMNDGERTAVAMKLAEGKRLMYKQPVAMKNTDQSSCLDGTIHGMDAIDQSVQITDAKLHEESGNADGLGEMLLGPSRPGYNRVTGEFTPQK